MHSMGSDLSIGSGGDLATASGSEAVRERVLRRLLTNPGEYIWQLTYGGGLAGFVGQVANVASIQAVVRGQMLLEPSVARTPAPTAEILSSGNGVVAGVITFADSETGLTQTTTMQLGSS